MHVLEINFWPVINSAGGAERVFCNMANELTIRGHKVSAVCFDNKIGMPFYPLAEEVNFYNLHKMGKPIKPPKWRKISRELFRIFGKNGFNDIYSRYIYREAETRLMTIIKDEKPDVVICYDINSLQLLQQMRLKDIKVVFMLHMGSESFWQNIKSEQITALRKVDYIQVLLPKDKEFLEKHLQREILVIPNCVIQVSKSTGETCRRKKIIVNIARLDKNKKQDLLIEAFARIASKYPEWRLELYGDVFTKNYRNKLENQIKMHNLTKQVTLMGVTHDSMAVLKKAAIFGFPSAYEGFPLAMTEAMSAGLPCIGLKSCLAVSQLITNDETGILTDDSADALAEGLESLMQDEALRTRLGRNAKKSMEVFAPEKVWNKWEELLYSMVAENNYFQKKRLNRKK